MTDHGPSLSADRAAKLADAVWVRLAARASMIVFGVAGTLAVPTVTGYLRDTSATLIALKESVAQIRADQREDKAHDAGRFLRIDDRITDHERRLQAIEARRP